MIKGLACAALLWGNSHVLAASITLTAQSGAPAIASLEQQLQSLRPHDRVLFVELAQLKSQASLLGQTLVVLDPASLEWRNQLPDGPPTLAIRFNTEAFARYQAQGLAPNISFLLSDPPLERQLTLAKLLQPHISRVGLVYPPDYIVSPSLRERARALGMQLIDDVWPNPSDRRPLVTVLEKSDVLLGLDSEQLYNATTIKNILLTSYGRDKALIGPTLSYVGAGSLASTYSDAEDWVLSLNAVLNRTPESWPTTLYPQHFKVRLNAQVARALGIGLPTHQQLQKRLAAWEQRP